MDGGAEDDLKEDNHVEDGGAEDDHMEEDTAEIIIWWMVVQRKMR